MWLRKRVISETRDAISPRGPGIGNTDVSLLKTFDARESLRVQFRAECFNVGNHPNFGLPVTDLDSGSFGRILEAGAPRLVQFGLKVLFSRYFGVDGPSKYRQRSAERFLLSSILLSDLRSSGV
jgi:hypothetical protein